MFTLQQVQSSFCILGGYDPKLYAKLVCRNHVYLGTNKFDLNNQVLKYKSFIDLRIIKFPSLKTWADFN